VKSEQARMSIDEKAERIESGPRTVDDMILDASNSGTAQTRLGWNGGVGWSPIEDGGGGGGPVAGAESGPGRSSRICLHTNRAREAEFRERWKRRMEGGVGGEKKEGRSAREKMRRGEEAAANTGLPSYASPCPCAGRRLDRWMDSE
jgi:hypothetical protein